MSFRSLLRSAARAAAAVGFNRPAQQPTDAEIRAALPALTGDIMQVPPAYSAIKVGGERAYDLAREGEDVSKDLRRELDDLRNFGESQGEPIDKLPPQAAQASVQKWPEDVDAALVA